MNLANLDLNLLVSLDALLQERSVTRAADRLGLSQPALSAALARLRRRFGDELLTRTGNRYELTPLAAQLKGQVAAALVSVERLFSSEATFSPGTSERDFHILLSDYAMAAIAGEVARIVAERGPHVRLRFSQVTIGAVDSVSETLRDYDAMVMPHGFVSELPHLDLYEDSWVCLVASSNPEVSDSLTLPALAELPWVFNYHAPTAFTSPTRQLQELGIEPQVRVVVQSFLALPEFIADTTRVAFVQAHLVSRMVADGRVRAVPCPFPTTPIREALWWHPMFDRDPGHAWLRAVFAEASAPLAHPVKLNA